MAILKVKTDCGWVQGLPGANQMISLFRGIPYAAPPVGELRWRPTQPAIPWDGVLKAYSFSAISYQERKASEGGGEFIGDEFYSVDYPVSEDCLYLNVWTPAKRGDEKLPVAVYLHGGGHTQGYGYLNCYDGEGFAKRDVVYVSINHRLGVFGYLAHPELTAEDEHHSSGNYGNMDIIEALKWIRRNIGAFGGDPDRVTIFGQSGGGSKVLSMMESPLAKGLFGQAIMQSGGGIDRFFDAFWTQEDAEKLGEEIFACAGVKNLEEARKAEASVIEAGMVAYCRKRGMAPIMLFGPSVDGYVLPKARTDMAMEGCHPDIPVMIGCTAEESVNPKAVLPAREEVLRQGTALFGADRAEDYLKALHYDEDPEQALEMFRRCVGMSGEFRGAVLAWCRNQNRLNRKPSYAYYFSLVPPGADSAHHSAEHHYVFQTLVRSRRPYTGRDYDLSNVLCDAWTNFVKNGDPNGDTVPAWPPYTEENPVTMNINYDMKAEVLPDNDLIRFYTRCDLKE